MIKYDDNGSCDMRFFSLVIVGLVFVSLLIVGCAKGPTPPEAPPLRPDINDSLGKVVCTADAMECPDGSFVGRVAPECRFAPCPTTTSGCTEEVRVCADGSTVGRVLPDCEFAPCASGVACTKEAKLCPDGSAVGRVPPDCEFAACPEPVMCAQDVRECPDGSFVSRVPPTCEFKACPAPSIQKLTIQADDNGFYPSGTLTFKPGTKVELTFFVRTTNVYYAGLDIRSELFDTGGIAPGGSKTVTFDAPSSKISFTSYWPSSGVKKASGTIGPK